MHGLFGFLLIQRLPVASRLIQLLDINNINLITNFIGLHSYDGIY